MAKLKSINPSNYQILGEVEISTAKEVDSVVRLARVRQRMWASLPLSARIEHIRNFLAETIKMHKATLTSLVAREMGMPIKEALTVDFQCGYDFAQRYCDDAPKYFTPKLTFENNTQIDRVYRKPRGVVGVIIPWNYPFLNVVWSSFQSLIAGNTVVLKHSEECPLSAKFIAELMAKHLPRGVFSVIYGDGAVGQLLMNQNIDMLHFVGSAKTGWLLYEQAAKKRIKAVMELGGSAPAIVFNDVDIDAAAQSVCDYRLGNAGQWCDGLKRLMVHKDIAVKFVNKVAEIFAKKRIGPAEREDTEIGPLVAKRQHDLIAQQVEDAQRKGAKVVTGGKSLEKKMGGAYYMPTLLTNVKTNMRVWREETFGPVLPVMTFKTEEEAIELANDTDYGLGGYVYTNDQNRAERVADAIESGMISVNGVNYTAPWNPFGGWKYSGMGFEHGEWGFDEVTKPKIISMPK